MKFNEKTTAQLTLLKQHMSDILQVRLEDISSPLGYFDKNSTELIKKKRHACRVTLYIPFLVEFCKENHCLPEIVSDEEITLLQYAAFFYASAEKQSNWQMESAESFRSFLESKGITELCALNFSDYITGVKKDILNSLLETACSLDSMRSEISLKLETVPLFTKLHSQEARDQFIQFIFKVQLFIASQNDLKYNSCNIEYKNERITLGLSTKEDSNLNQVDDKSTVIFKEMVLAWHALNNENLKDQFRIDSSYYERLGIISASIEEKMEQVEPDNALLFQNTLRQAELYYSKDKETIIFCFTTEKGADRFLQEVKKKNPYNWSINQLKYTHETSIPTSTPYSVRLSSRQMKQFLKMKYA